MENNDIVYIEENDNDNDANEGENDPREKRLFFIDKLFSNFQRYGF